MSPKDGRSKEISQRRDQLARSIVDVLLNGQSPGKPPPSCLLRWRFQSRRRSRGPWITGGKVQPPHRVSLVLLCALKHPPDTAVRKLEAVLYCGPCSEIANIWAARLELRSSRAFAAAEPNSCWSGPGSRRGWSGDLFLQFGAGFADLRRHERTVLNLKENALGLLAVAHCCFLHLRGHGERIAGQRLALLDALDQFRAHRLDLFCRSFVFADNGFGRQLTDLRGPLTMLDIVRHRQGRPADLWRRKNVGPRLVVRRPVSHLCLDLAFQISHAQDSSNC